MTAWLADRHRAWTYTLEIAGLPVRYCSGPIAPAQVPGLPPGTLYTDVLAIASPDGRGEGVSSLGSTLRATEPVARHDSIRVTLARRDGAAGDPLEVFSRVGRRSASTAAQVTRTIQRPLEAPLEILVDRDMSGLSYPRLAHIGSEAVWLTDADGSHPDPGHADPYRVTASARAVAGTRPRSHQVIEAKNDRPLLVTPELVHWRTRHAILYAEPRDGTGGRVEVMRGFLERTPEPARDGTSVSVEIVPLTQLLERDVELVVPGESAGLVTGYHELHPGAASRFEVAIDVPRYQAHIVVDLDDDTLLGVDRQACIAWRAAFDLALPMGHPRAGDVAVGADRATYHDVVDVNVDVLFPAFGEVILEVATPADVSDGAPVAGRVATEARRVDLVDERAILLWPGTPDDGLDGVTGRINAGLAADTHLGAAGAPVAVQIDGSAEPPTLTIIRADDHVRDPLSPHIRRVTPPPWHVPDFTRCHSSRWPGATPQIPDTDPTEHWDTVWGPVPELWRDLGDGAGLRPLPLSRVDELLWWPLMWAALDDRRVVEHPPGPTTWWRMPIRGNRRGDANSRPLLAVASGWHQRGEPSCLVDAPLDISAGVVRVRAENPRSAAGGPVLFTAEVSAIEEIALPAFGPRAGESVWRLTFSSPADVPSFGEWPAGVGMESGLRVEVSRGAHFATAGGALRWILTAEAGLGLGEAEVDLASVDAIEDPPWAAGYTLPGGPGRSLAEAVREILRVTRSALTMRTDELGRCRITRIPVGPEITVGATIHIDGTRWSSERQSWGHDDELVNAIEISTGWVPDLEQPGEGEFERLTIFRDSASIEAHGDRETEVIEARGLDPDVPSVTLLPLATGIFRDLAEPRREWRGRVDTRTGLRCAVGEVVAVTSPHLRGMSGGEGVVEAVGRVVRRRLALWGEGCDLEIVHYGASGTGWNVALEVVEVISPLIVRVAANAYSEPAHPYTGAPQTDLDAVAVGDVMRCEPACDQDAGVEREVDHIDRETRQVVFDGAHGLAVGDTIVPPPRADASELHRRYAWLGDGDADVQELV